jgi:hypothetical protein
MQLRIPILALSLTLAAEARAAPNWVDGPAANITTQCGADFNNPSRSLITKAGMVIDSIAETPQRGQVVMIHAVATNTNCAAEDVMFDFHLPAGASLAISAQTPVKCNLYKDATRFDALGACSQTPLPGNNGGLRFADREFIPPKSSVGEWTYEIQVPVIYNQATNAPVAITTVTSLWGARIASIDANVPYQPPLPSYTRGDDLVLLGSVFADPGTLPVAFANDNGLFTVTNHIVGDFASWARQANVKRLSGDFNKDGLTDYALVGGAGWRTIPVAMSQGNGKFTITNNWVGDFGAWAEGTNVKPVAGDFNRDGHTDIALVGGTGWNTLPIAFSARGGGNGHFEITNQYIGDFATWAQAQGARPIAGDYNRDGMTDIALVGGNGWTMLPVAYSYGNGTFQAFNAAAWGIGFREYYPYQWNFAQSVNEPGAQLIATDFNKDGMTDLLVVGGSSQGIRFAMSYGNGTWQLFERSDVALASYARLANVKVLTGDFNKDGWPDLALTGVSGWNQIPIATNQGGNGFWSTSLRAVGDFGSWAATPGVRPIVGDFNGDGFSDIALTGANGWGSIPVAINNGAGFTIVNGGANANRFPRWSSDTSASLFSGRVNY